MNTKHTDGAEDLLPQLVERVERADAKLVTVVRERPIAALVTALAVGYVVGRIVSRLS